MVSLHGSLKKEQAEKKKKTQVHLQEGLEISSRYFDQIRQMWQGADDNYKGNYIVYFKECYARDINPIPMLFKSLRSNTLYLKGTRVSFE